MTQTFEKSLSNEVSDCHSNSKTHVKYVKKDCTFSKLDLTWNHFFDSRNTAVESVHLNSSPPAHNKPQTLYRKYTSST